MKSVTLDKPLRIAGLAARTSNAREMDPGKAAIPGLWQRFMQEQPKAGASAAVYSVYTEYESDVNGAYTVVIGRQADIGAIAEKTVTIPAGKYLEFTSTGEMPAAVVNGWKQVWEYFARSEAPARAYTADFEVYDPATPETVKIWIAVK